MERDGSALAGARFFPAHWFDRGIADYGQSQGNVATGFILAEMADPAHTTGAALGYGYKQLFYEPFLGGGILTALSVPLIISIGSLAFGIASAITTAGFIIWGCRAESARQAGDLVAGLRPVEQIGQFAESLRARRPGRIGPALRTRSVACNEHLEAGCGGKAQRLADTLREVCHEPCCAQLDDSGRATARR
jgi:hypothetical protein